MDLADKTAIESLLIIPHPLPNGDTAYVRSLSGKQRQEWVEAIRAADHEGDTLEEFWFTLIHRTIYSKSGEPIFAATDDFHDTPTKRLEMLFHAASEVNGISIKSEENAKKN
jgi:hypothetical protein